MKMDIVVLTRNSERLLKECLTSVYREDSVCHLILVDGFSTDRTLEIAGAFQRDYGNAKIIQTKARHGKAREIGIKNVDAEWFAFVDSDCVLPPDWFEKILSHIREGDTKIGAVESNFVHHYPEGTPRFPQFEHVVDGRRVDPRALTIATLVRKEAVRDIVVPDDLPIYEDEFIKRWIEKQGFVWIKVVDPVIDHFPNPRPFKDAYLMGIYSIRHGVISPWRIVLVGLLSPAKLLYFWGRTRSFTASWNSTLLSLYMLKGLIQEVLGISSDAKNW